MGGGAPRELCFPRVGLHEGGPTAAPGSPLYCRYVPCSLPAWPSFLFGFMPWEPGWGFMDRAWVQRPRPGRSGLGGARAKLFLEPCEPRPASSYMSLVLVTRQAQVLGARYCLFLFFIKIKSGEQNSPVKPFRSVRLGGF